MKAWNWCLRDSKTKLQWLPKGVKVEKTLTGKQKLDYHFITGMEVDMTASNWEVLAVLWMDNVPVMMLMIVHNIHSSKSYMITERKYL